MKAPSVEKHFDKVAKNYDSGKNKYSYYYSNLKKLLSSLIPPDSKVCEIGCGTGDLLVSLKPKDGYGMDVSGEMIKIAKLKYKPVKNLTFSTVWPKDKYDYIFMSDVIEHLESPKETLLNISKIMGKNSVFINTMANPLWEALLLFWEKMGWKMREGPHKRIRSGKFIAIMKRIGLKTVKHDYRLLVPIKIPLITDFANEYLEKILKPLAFIEYFVMTKE